MRYRNAALPLGVGILFSSTLCDWKNALLRPVFFQLNWCTLPYASLWICVLSTIICSARRSSWLSSSILCPDWDRVWYSPCSNVGHVTHSRDQAVNVLSTWSSYALPIDCVMFCSFEIIYNVEPRIFDDQFVWCQVCLCLYIFKPIYNSYLFILERWLIIIAPSVQNKHFVPLVTCLESLDENCWVCVTPLCLYPISWEMSCNEP